MATPTPSIDEIAHRLGMKASDVDAFKTGQVVTEERDASNEKDLCLLVAAMLPASMEKSWNFVTQEKVDECQDATLSQGFINLETFELEGFQFDHGTAGNLNQYNMSASEAKTFGSAGDKKAAFKQILSARAKAFWENGLKGVEPYSGKNHDIADDLETANKTVLKVIHDPKIQEEITVVPSKSQLPECHTLMWNIVQGNSISSIVLCHKINYKKGDEGFLRVIRKFYSATDFDSSMISAAVLPTLKDTKSAVFYVNHTYTASVAGFGGGTKRSVGRKMMKGALVETMKKAQKTLA